MDRAYFNWSSGKDSALALYRAMKSRRLAIQTLFTAVPAGGSVAMHEVGIDLLKRQAEAIGLPLTLFSFDPAWTPEEYSKAMGEQAERFKKQGISTALFGDLYLENLRRSRERACARAGLRAEFPLWNAAPQELMEEFLRLGFRAVVTCVDGSVLDEGFVGRVIDEAFLKELPHGADICGENGEYHSFVFDGPIFHRPVPVEVAGTYYRDYPAPVSAGAKRYWYAELIISGCTR